MQNSCLIIFLLIIVFFWLIVLHDPLRLCKQVLPWSGSDTLGYRVAKGNASVPDRLDLIGLVEMNWRRGGFIPSRKVGL